jgi:hypothetical protein
MIECGKLPDLILKHLFDVAFPKLAQVIITDEVLRRAVG